MTKQNDSPIIQLLKSSRFKITGEWGDHALTYMPENETWYVVDNRARIIYKGKYERLAVRALLGEGK